LVAYIIGLRAKDIINARSYWERVKEHIGNKKSSIFPWRPPPPPLEKKIGPPGCMLPPSLVARIFLPMCVLYHFWPGLVNYQYFGNMGHSST